MMQVATIFEEVKQQAVKAERKKAADSKQQTVKND